VRPAQVTLETAGRSEKRWERGRPKPGHALEQAFCPGRRYPAPVWGFVCPNRRTGGTKGGSTRKNLRVLQEVQPITNNLPIGGCLGRFGRINALKNFPLVQGALGTMHQACATFRGMPCRRFRFSHSAWRSACRCRPQRPLVWRTRPGAKTCWSAWATASIRRGGTRGHAQRRGIRHIAGPVHRCHRLPRLAHHLRPPQRVHGNGHKGHGALCFMD